MQLEEQRTQERLARDTNSPTPSETEEMEFLSAGLPYSPVGEASLAPSSQSESAPTQERQALACPSIPYMLRLPLETIAAGIDQTQQSPVHLH